MFFTDRSEPAFIYTLREIRHDYLLNFSQESLFEGTDRTFSKIHVELPYPIHKPFKISEDLVQRLVKDKTNYKSRRESIRKRYTRYDKKDIVKEKYASHKYMYLPRYLVNWYEERDPDPTFDSDYNYYYTGGNLEHFQYKGNEYLIRPDVDNTLCLTNVLNDDLIKMNFTTDSTIYNINSINTNDGLYFTVREKNRINIVKLRKLQRVSLKYSKEFKGALLDSKLSEGGKLGLLSTTNKFSIRDIETDKTLISFKSNLSEEIDNFQQFRFINENTVMIMNRRNIKVIDIRSKTEEMCFEPKLIKCNCFCNFIPLDNTLLVATKHYILKTDLRSFDEVYHYSHSLSEAPCYLDFTKKDSDTYLAVSGQSCDSRVLFTGKSPFSLPNKIPSLKRTLVESTLRYPTLALEHHLDNRLSTSVTGLKVLNLNSTINIFTSNYFGEIFNQKVFDTEPNKTEPTDKFFEWSIKIDKPEAALHLTHFEDISDVRFSLNQPILQKNLNHFHTCGKGKDFLTKFGHKYSNGNVTSQLARDFLSIWEDTDDEDKEVDDLPEEETLDKVNNWIQSHDFQEDYK